MANPAREGTSQEPPSKKRKLDGKSLEKDSSKKRKRWYRTLRTRRLERNEKRKKSSKKSNRLATTKVCTTRSFSKKSKVSSKRRELVQRKFSLSSSKLSQFDFENCALIDFLKLSITIPKNDSYNLQDIASHYDVDVSQFSSNHSNKAAKKIFQDSLVRSRRYSIIQEGSYIFNGVKSDNLVNMYSTKNNALDVAVTIKKKDGLVSILCAVEVHSSPYIETIRKLIYGLVQLLRVVKAHGIGDCILIGFTFPKLTVKTVVTKVTVSYITNKEKFISSASIVKLDKIQSEINNAIAINKATLHQCKQFKTEAIDYVIMYSPEELQQYGERAVQKICNYGVLIETEVNKTLSCVKRPIHMLSCYQLMRLCHLPKEISGIIHYKEYKLDTFYYPRVSHDPLDPEELRDCLYFFIPSVVKIIQELHKIDVIHRDIRVPNICFDDKHMPVLIDFDFSKMSDLQESKEEDMQIFINDVIKHMCATDEYKGKEEEFLKDKFLNTLKKGKLNDKLMEKSIIARHKKTIKEVIMSRQAQQS